MLIFQDENQIKNQVFVIVEACNEWRGPSPLRSPGQRSSEKNIAAVASLRRFDRRGNGTSDLSHYINAPNNYAKGQ